MSYISLNDSLTNIDIIKNESELDNKILLKRSSEPCKSISNKYPREYRFSAIINYKDDTYYIDSCDTDDSRYELMIFPVYRYFPNKAEKLKLKKVKLGKLSFVTKEVMDAVGFLELYTKIYKTIDEAERDFDYIVNNFSDFYKEVLYPGEGEDCFK